MAGSPEDHGELPNPEDFIDQSRCAGDEKQDQ
jgi:hypothetical protein